MKDTIFVEVAIRTKPFQFAETVLGYNEFEMHTWESKIFEVKYTTGRRQTKSEVLYDALQALKKVYGVRSVRFRNAFDGFADDEKNNSSQSKLELR
jgi:hypothetical protein